MREGPGPCPDEHALLAFLYGRATADRSDLRKHLEACPLCSDVATWVAADGSLDISAAQLAPGVLVGRYQILGLIGRGGMGEVYAAYHPDLDRRIALKVVYGERAADPERQYRLLREARIIARLSHPNIVAVYDAGIVGEQVFLAMEFVDGQTVDAWVRESEPRWQDVVDVFVAAARGLTAAHAADVVHRDFKPQNVMIGRDGRVRVMDFGLARPVQESHQPAPLAVGLGWSAGSTSTTVGALVGTPAYMAPEQLRGVAVDVRADQFSFCVALYEAIYGMRPGVVSPERVGRGARRVPGWIKGILRKGLEADREKRFASLHELLRHIERRRKPIRTWALTSAGAVVLAAALTVGVRASKPPQLSCTAALARTEAVWPSTETSGTRRAALHRLFLTSGLTAGEAAWNRIAAVFDDRLRRWRAMYQDACEATHVRGEQSPQVLDLRMSCLTDNLDATRAYVDGLLESDPSRLERASATATSLPSIQRCADLKDLRSRVPLPADRRARDEIERLQQVINDAEALRSLRYEKRAEAELKSVLPKIRALGYKPLLAQALQKMTAALGDLERYPEAGATAQEALRVAEASRDDTTAAQVADELGWINTFVGRLDVASQWLDFGEAVVERMDAGGTLVQGWLLNDRGNLHYLRGQFDQAERDHRAAIAIKARLLGQVHPDVSGSIGNLAADLEELDRWGEAGAMARRALYIDEQVGNQRSQAYAYDRTVMGEILAHTGQRAEAQIVLSEALSLEEEFGDDANLVMTETLTDLGRLRLAEGRGADALTVLRRAQALQNRIGERSPIRLAVTAVELGRAMVETRTNVSRGEQLAAEACGTLGRGGFTRDQREIHEWSQHLRARDRRRIAEACSGAG